MEFHERTDRAQQARQGQPGEDPAAGLENLRAEGRDLLDAADDAIRNALSGNSLEFLNSVRQTGGE